MSSTAVDDDVARHCGWCRRVLATTNPRARFCRRKCRQAAFRLRQRHAAAGATAAPGTFIYADPPYPGTSAKYYRDEPTYAGEVDFRALIASLRAAHDRGDCLGWALSTSARSLRELLPLCPPAARVCAWVKPIGVSSRTYGVHNTWEPLIAVVGRQRRPGKRDWLRAMPARSEGTLPGRKPLAFCAWLFDVLGMRPGDTLIDLFPGTGIVSRAWTELSSGAGVTLPDSATVVNRGERPSAGSAATVATWSQRLSFLERPDTDVVQADRRLSLTPASATAASLVDERDAGAPLEPRSG